MLVSSLAPPVAPSVVSLSSSGMEPFATPVASRHAANASRGALPHFTRVRLPSSRQSRKYAPPPFQVAGSPSMIMRRGSGLLLFQWTGENCHRPFSVLRFWVRLTLWLLVSMVSTLQCHRFPAYF